MRDAGLMLARDLAAAVQPSLLLPALPALLPRLLACAAEQEAREVALAADEALERLLQRAPPQACLGLLAEQLPPAGAALPVDRRAGAELYAAVRGLRRVVARMQPAGLSAHLQPLLVPGLCAAYSSPLCDVRKATVDCLVAIWQVGGGCSLCRGVPAAMGSPFGATCLGGMQPHCWLLHAALPRPAGDGRRPAAAPGAAVGLPAEAAGHLPGQGARRGGVMASHPAGDGGHVLPACASLCLSSASCLKAQQGVNRFPECQSRVE